MKKQIQLILSALFMVLTGLTAYGQQNVGGQFTTSDGISYEITSTAPAQVEIVGYTGSATNVTIPGMVTHHGTGFEVTRIENHAFRDTDTPVTRVTIGPSVTSIGIAAFLDGNLTEVTIPNGMTSIEGSAFFNNQLTEVTLPNSVTFLGNAAFWGNDLTSVTIGGNLTSIANNAFRDNNLTEVIIPDSVISIGQRAFRDNPNLTRVILKGAIPPSIHANTFTNANRGQIDLFVPPGMRQDYLDHGWTGFKSITETTFTVNGIEYQVTAQGSTNTVTIVNYTGSATSVTIPQTVDHALDTYTVTAIGGGEAENQQPFRDKGLTHVTIPNTVTSIGIGAFNRNDLTEVTLPDGVTKIPKWAFAQNQLTEVTIPASVDNIGEQAFFRNTDLKLVTMEANNPPTLHVTAFQGDNTDLRDQIDVIVPNGAKAAYENPANGWTDFNSITEELDNGNNFTVNGIEYQVTAQGSANTVTIVDYTGSATNVNIPQTVTYQGSEFEVTRIGNAAFLDNNLTEVTLPNSVTSIGTGAFLQNQLTSITLSNNLEHLSKDVFKRNNLTSVDIPQGVTFIGNSAFSQNDLVSVTLPNSVETIDLWAFADNPNLATVVSKPTDPPSIEENTFTNANRAQIDVIVPNGAKAAYDNPANGWTGFKSITEEVAVGVTFTVAGIEYRITALGSTNTVTTVDYTGSATSVTIPGEVNYGPHNFEVTGIGARAFQGNQLTSVEIPEGVASIGNDAFRDNQLTSVEIPEGVASIGIRAFMDNRDMGGLVIPSTVTSIGNSAFWNCGLSSLQIPEGITDIGDNTFGRNNLTSVTIPASVTSIGGSAFMTLSGSSSKMTELIMLGSAPPTLQADSFTTRGEIDVTVPTGALAGYQAREGSDWNGFKSITEPVDVGVGDSFTVNGIEYRITALGSTNTVTTVDYTGSATNVTIPGEVSYGPHNFEVTSIGAQAFQGNQLTTVTLPDGVTSIGNDAFRDNQLTSVEIPEGVASIGIRAFMDNRDMGSLVIPSTVTSIGNSAFWNCGLSSLQIPEGITDIGDNTFGRNNLTSATIPASVTSIGGSAFMTLSGSPSKMTELIMLGSAPPTLQDNSFTTRGEIDVTVPTGALANYQAREGSDWNGFKSITEPVDVGVGDSFTVNGIVYQVTAQGSTNTVTIVNYTGSATSVTIPGEVSYGPYNFEVTSIGAQAFRDNQLQGHLVIPNSITSIGHTAFMGNQLTRVTLSENVTSIPGHVFRNNQLTEVTLPDGVTSIGQSAFSTNQLTSVTISNTVTSIGTDAFRNNQLTKLTIPAGVTSIGGSAFMTLPGSPSKMTELIMLGSAPPTLQNSSFTTRGEIDVTVPTGALANYQAREGSDWNGFKSIRGDTGADNEAPTAVLAPITLALDENGRATLLAAHLDNGSTDNRTVAEDLRFSFDADGNETDRVFDCSDLGDNQVTVYVTDEDENSATATVVVTVEAHLDNLVAPTISSNGPICPGGNAIFTFTGTPGDRVTYSGALSGEVIIEADGTATVTVSGASSDTTLNVTGATNGNCSVPFSETATVTIQDSDSALTARAKDITVQLDAGGQAVITPEMVDNGSSYGCGNVPNLSLDIDSFDCNDVGTPVTVTLTAAQNGQTATATAVVTVLSSALAANGCDTVASDALRVLVMTPSCTDSADGSVAVIMDDPGYRMDISIGGGTMGNRFFSDIPSGSDFEIDGLAVGDYTVTVTIPEISLERTFGARVNGMGPVSGKRGSLDRKEGRATYVVSGSDRYEVSVNGGKMDFAFGDTGPQSIQLENLYGHTEVVISGRNGCQGKVTDSFFVDSVLAEVYPTVTSSFITILTQGDHLDVQVHTLSGRLVKGARFTERENIMDLSFLGSGMYILKMASKGKEQTIKIIKR